MKKKLLFIIIPLLLIAGTAVGAFYYVNSKIYVPTEPNGIFDNTEEQKEAQIEEEKGIINVLLVGLDGREKDEGSRTDSIILATADTNNKRVKLSSFMRDMYVPIPNHGNNRINAAYSIGGSDLLIKTINQDFGLSIQYYMSIDFRAFQELVDQVGGIDVTVKDYEVNEINKYIKEVNGSDAKLLQGAGFQHLNGQQALSYSRIRKVGRDDYERTERQRRVLSLLIDKARKTSPLKFPQLFSSILPYVKTNIPTSKLMSMAYTAYKFGNTPVETMRLPADGAFESTTIEAGSTPMSVLLPNLQKNAEILDKFLFSTGGSFASDMPVYMANDFHSKDTAVDKRGQKKPVVKVEVVKPKPTTTPPTTTTAPPPTTEPPTTTTPPATTKPPTTTPPPTTTTQPTTTEPPATN